MMGRFDLSQIHNGSFRPQQSFWLSVGYPSVGYTKYSCLELFIDLHFSFFLVRIFGKVGGVGRARQNGHLFSGI